jgi:hypothetical protein
MIDLSTESTISLNHVPPLLPPGRRGARVSFSCLLRWVIDGVKSPSGEVVRLEAARLGNRWITSREALQRFADRLTPKTGDSPPVPAPTPNQRERAAQKAAAELAAMGI